MKRFSLFTLAAATIAVPFAGNVLLQDDTPGTVQSGHINVSGTVKAGQFIANSTATTGQVISGDFRTLSNQGRAILGNASSPTGATFGGLFQNASNGGRAVAGLSTATDGTTYGGFFGNTSIKGRAVYGQATAATGTTYGVYGKSVSPDGFGVFSEGNMSATGVISGNGSGLTNVAPSGPAGGFLTGTYPNPFIENNVITNANLQLDSESLAKVSGGLVRVKTANQVIVGNGANGIVGFSLAGMNFGFLSPSGQLTAELTSGTNERSSFALRSPTQKFSVFATVQENTGLYRGSIDVRDNNGTTQASMLVDAAGNGVVAADTKNFRIPNPEDPKTDIWYASLEGPEAAVYLRGTAHLFKGKAFIPFPDHFRSVAISDGMTTSLTPRSIDTYGLAVIELSTAGITVAELKGGKGSFEFDWRVEAVRKGHEDFRVIRPWDESLGDEQSRSDQWKARLKSIADKKVRQQRSAKR